MYLGEAYMCVVDISGIITVLRIIAGLLTMGLVGTEVADALLEIGMLPMLGWQQF